MDISLDTHGDDVLLTVEESRIDAASAVQFKDEMRRLTDGRFRRVVLDLSRVDFIDSSGLGAIVGVMKHLGPERQLELAGLTPNVTKVFRLTRMDTVFPIHDTPGDAFPGLEHAS